MAVSKSRVPPLVLTRSGNAGRAKYAPLSLSGQAPRSIIKLSIGLSSRDVKAKTVYWKKEKDRQYLTVFVSELCASILPSFATRADLHPSRVPENLSSGD